MTSINELTVEQIQELLELSQRLKEREERADRDTRPSLPEEIYDELEQTPNSELKNKLKRFAIDTIKYEGGKWTKSGAINNMFGPELIKFNVDATQTVAAIHKGADRLRTASRAAAEMYSDVQWIINEGGIEQDMQHILEKVKRLTIYGFATSKELDGDAKELTTKALRLPTSVRYLEDTEEDDKELVFSPEIVEKIQQARYEDSLLKSATNKSFGGYGFKPRGQHRGGYKNEGHRGGSFFG
ncbi:uncharacterized protein EV154DRAFT_427421 [Mucor mucedo]|uniref:uncharacterized protein n=1 Tax=Mucor mucedo TaxID=29922 RepID=UPI002220170F|nr:uncharacterized protein EV154DRAFT_427421 [Mucor mucedo]KAI7886545.1 hypothetical protein EV154DRAFT_427421 [Mucor mucedo]